MIITIFLFFPFLRYHRLFMHGFKLVTFYRDCAHFWKQLVRGEQHTLNYPETSKTEQTTETLTPGTIEFRPARTLGGHVACVLSLLATNKVRTFINLEHVLYHKMWCKSNRHTEKSDDKEICRIEDFNCCNSQSFLRDDLKGEYNTGSAKF